MWASKARQGSWGFLPRAAATWEVCDGGKTLGTDVRAGGRWIGREEGGKGGFSRFLMGPERSSKKHFAVTTCTCKSLGDTGLVLRLSTNSLN